MTKIVGLVMLLIGVSGMAMADVVIAPEIDPGSAASALALLSGAALIFRSSRRK